MKVLYVNNSTFEHFGSKILDDLKHGETKTKRALRIFLNSGIREGERFGIAWGGFVRGSVVFRGIKEYQTEDEFNEDFRLHLVGNDSKYKFDLSKGKSAILVDGARWYRNHVKVTQKHGRVWTETD